MENCRCNGTRRDNQDVRTYGKHMDCWKIFMLLILPLFSETLSSKNCQALQIIPYIMQVFFGAQLQDFQKNIMSVTKTLGIKGEKIVIFFLFRLVLKVL